MQSSLCFIAALAFFAVALAAPQHEESHGEHHHEEHDASYKFKYGVEDHHTGDIKSQHEERHGKEVSGVYTLKEADGTTRIVKYTAGPHSGFNAIVERTGHAQHPQHYGHHEEKKSEGGDEHKHEEASSYVGVTHYGYKHGEDA